MLNPFPVQFLTPLTFLLFRVVLGAVFVRSGYRIFLNEHATLAQQILGVLLMGTGAFLILGLYTQIATILGAILSVGGLIRPQNFPAIPRMSLLFMFVISISLFITGAGPFAFDLPI